MAAPRATQFIALRNLSRNSHHQIRRLHMTGPATYSSPVLTNNHSLDAAEEHTHSRAFSTSIQQSKRPQTPSPQPTLTRHFNTTHHLQAVNDTSTIDFAYLPTSVLAQEETSEILRVPILPTTFRTSPNNTDTLSPTEAPVMKPEISTMSADAVYSPMSELSDGHAMNVDFHELADRVAANLKRMQVPVEERAGLMKRIWGDLVDDVLGGGGGGGKKVAV